MMKPVYYLLILVILGGCLPDDTAYPLIPFKGVIGTTTQSIYTYQSFYSLADSTQVSVNLITDWDLGFEASANGEHVILNSADLLFIANLGATNFDQPQTPAKFQWTYDASSGSFDSLAIDGWVNTQQTPYQYSHNVYYLGREGDNGIVPVKKFKIIALTQTNYTLVTDNPDNSDRDTLIVPKNEAVNFTKVCIRNKPQVVAVEPPKTDWDLLFTQYQDTIPDDNGVLYSYVLRGVFINPFKTKVACYTISEAEVPVNTTDKAKEEDELKRFFEDAGFNQVPEELYQSYQDVIGWDWKDVTIDEGANTAVYKANTRKIYFIRDTQTGYTYKLRFFGYYTQGVAGYPWFQYIRVN